MSAFAESLRSIRNVFIVADNVSAGVIAICSALPGEGKSVVSLTLARMMAMSGDSVVIVDCDMRLGKQARMAAIAPTKGLTELLAGEATLDEVLCLDERTGLMILPLATCNFSSKDFFAGESMRQLLVQLRQRFRFVILDTPPVLAVAEARTIAAQADSVILLARANHTSRFAVSAALARLKKAKARVVGAVLTGVQTGARGLDPSDPGYYAHSYESYYQS
jgi:capsular exopolysaccharide synthesis family protein